MENIHIDMGSVKSEIETEEYDIDNSVDEEI
jgi:hypothetical protein